MGTLNRHATKQAKTQRIFQSGKYVQIYFDSKKGSFFPQKQGAEKRR